MSERVREQTNGTARCGEREVRWRQQNGGVGGKNSMAHGGRSEKCTGDREARTRTARGQFYSLRCASELSAARPRLTGSRVTHIFVRGDRRRGGNGREREKEKRENTGGGARALRLRLTAPISRRRERRHATSFRPAAASARR